MTQTTLGNGVVDSAGSLALRTNGTTTAVTVDTSQNVGIGTSSPVQKLHVNSASTGGIQVTNGITGATSSDGFWIGVDSSGEAYLYNYENTGTRFYTNNTERARIDSSGNWLVGATSTTNLAKMLMSFTSASNGFYLDETSNSSGT